MWWKLSCPTGNCHLEFTGRSFECGRRGFQTNDDRSQITTTLTLISRIFFDIAYECTNDVNSRCIRSEQQCIYACRLIHWCIQKSKLQDARNLWKWPMALSNFICPTNTRNTWKTSDNNARIQLEITSCFRICGGARQNPFHKLEHRE